MGLLDILGAAGQGLSTYAQANDALQQRDRQQKIEEEEREAEQRRRVLEEAILQLDYDKASAPEVTRYDIRDGQVVPQGGFTDRAEAERTAGAQRAAARRQRMVDNNREVLQAERVAEATARGRAAVPAPAPAPRPPDPSDLRGEFQNNPVLKDTLTIAQAYRRLRSVAAQPPTGAGDLAIIFSYMKILDPGSTVREGEFANAENAQGIPDRIRTLYNRALNGERLADDTRREFVANTEALVQGQAQSLDPVIQRYTTLATQGGMNPADVTYNPLADLGLTRQATPDDLAGMSDEEIWARVMGSMGR